MEIKDNVYLKPHPVAFMDQYLFWIYLIIAARIIYLKIDMVFIFFKQIEFIETQTIIDWDDSVIKIILFCICHLLFNFIPMMLMGAKKISVKMIIAAVMIFILMVSVLVYLKTKKPDLNFFLIWTALFSVAGACCFVATEYRRRNYEYKIERKGVSCKHKSIINDELMFYPYTQISHIYMKRTFFERLFNCGTIIVLPTSGMNLGSDSVRSGLLFYLVGIERTKMMPRSMPVFSLFSVKDSKDVFNRLLQNIDEC